MDNMCTVYDVNNRDSTGAAKIVRELAGYEGFLSSCRFLDDSHILTGSGDMKMYFYLVKIVCIEVQISKRYLFFRCIWDLENGKKTTEFDAHCGDVVTISLAPDGNTYLTGSVDKTCKLWDVRETSPRQVFVGHSADVNSVCVSISDLK